jgi:hypothetical protein
MSTKRKKRAKRTRTKRAKPVALPPGDSIVEAVARRFDRIDAQLAALHGAVAVVQRRTVLGFFPAHAVLDPGARLSFETGSARHSFFIQRLLVSSGAGVVLESFALGNLEVFPRGGVPAEFFSTAALTGAALPDNIGWLYAGHRAVLTAHNASSERVTMTVGATGRLESDSERSDRIEATLRADVARLTATCKLAAEFCNADPLIDAEKFSDAARVMRAALIVNGFVLAPDPLRVCAKCGQDVYNGHADSCPYIAAAPEQAPEQAP